MQNHPPKICLVGHSLASGGAEKAMAALSQFLTRAGVEVHLVIVVDEVSYPFDGTLVNLGLCTSRVAKFLQLYRYLRLHRFDYIIDFRMRPGFWQEWITQKIIYNAPVVYTVHSANLEWYFPANTTLGRWLYQKAFAVVPVSQAMAGLLEVYGLKNVEVIPNPLPVDAINAMATDEVTMPDRFILAVGRMDANKQFDRLIETYAKSTLPTRGISLVILGDGPQRTMLQNQVSSLNLDDKVLMPGAVSNPYPYFKKSMFLVLSSKVEGLPTVILESLCCATPVVSFDCPTGPSQLIFHRQNGLVVTNQDFEELLKAMEELSSSEALRLKCKANAPLGLDAYLPENVGKAWLDLLKIRLS